MTKAEEFYEARKLAYSGDFSISDSIYHPEFQAMDYRVGMEVNINMQKAIVIRPGARLRVWVTHEWVTSKVKEHARSQWG